jgi:hypothetical protein
MEKWAVISVMCTDGKIRFGIEMEDDSPKSSIVKGGLHYEYASAMCDITAKEMGYEVFDNTDPNYDLQDSINIK